MVDSVVWAECKCFHQKCLPLSSLACSVDFTSIDQFKEEYKASVLFYSSMNSDCFCGSRTYWKIKMKRWSLVNWWGLLRRGGRGRGEVWGWEGRGRRPTFPCTGWKHYITTFGLNTTIWRELFNDGGDANLLKKKPTKVKDDIHILPLLTDSTCQQILEELTRWLLIYFDSPLQFSPW